MAVRVIASVIDDQLAQPKDEAVVSDHAFEVPMFCLDREMAQYAVDHAAELAFDLRNMMWGRGCPERQSRRVSSAAFSLCQFGDHLSLIQR